MRTRLVLASALPLLAGVLAAARPSAADAPRVDGKAVYEGKGNCASCHGADGTGTRIAPDLTDGVWLHGDGSLRVIEEVVRNGVAEPVEASIPMPPMGGATLTPDEVSAVAAYVHSLSH